MSNELDLVHDFMNGDDVPATELVGARSILDEAIRSEGLPDSAGVVDAGLTHRAWRLSRRRTGWVVATVAAVAAGALIIVQVVPTPKTRPPVAAAAQISHLAAAVQPTPLLQAGQWSSYQLTGLLTASVSTVGKTPTPNAQASIPIGLQVWSNSTGTTCTSQQFGTATFAAPVNADAWHAIGLIDAPTNQPVTDCAAGLQAAMSAGSNLASINVSNLTHEPNVLASQLQTGTTGISSIDQTAVGDPAGLAGFLRLTALIVGPTNGGWPGLNQQLLETMALLPGVTSTGSESAHSGQTGMAFSTTQRPSDPTTGQVISSWTPPTIILDPTTGALLEARNFTIPVLPQAAQDFVGSPSAPVYTNGVSYGISAQWIDPVGPASIIDQAALPTWIATFHVIEATGLPNVGLQTMANVINQFLGTGNSAFDDPAFPTSDQTTFDITIKDPSTDVATVVAALNASGLFQSVTMKS
ncbi:MAG TPA: hypothetical protein VHV57_09910 [Acidimicrobiales bacterium]|jgi:hypothetical protein|nr:hypothetical protein [Acidimicrobiales bacterium]